MSDSTRWTPPPGARSTSSSSASRRSNSSRSPRSSARRRIVWLLTAGGALSAGWVASILIHGGLLGAMVFYKPFREAVFQPRREAAKVTASSDTIAEVAQIIRDENRDIVKANVEHLQLVLSDMERRRLENFESYRSFAQDLVAASPQRAVEAQRRALAAQDQTIQAQSSDADAQQTARAALREQGPIDAAQDEARRMLELAGPAFAEALAAQQAAIAAQTQAGQQQLEARQRAEAIQSAVARVAQLREELGWRQEEQARQQEAVKQASAELENARTTSETMGQRTDREQAEADAAEAARHGLKGDEARAAERAFHEQRDEAGRAKREAGDARRRFEDRTRRLEAEERGLDDRDRRVAEAQQRIDEALAVEAQARLDLQAAQAEAGNSQQQAKATQQEALVALESALANDATVDPSPMPDATARELLSPMQLEQMDVAELYRAARTAEAEVSESFRELRAAELARIREVDLEEAIASTDVPRPVRPELDAQTLVAEPRSTDALDRQKQAVQTAVRETDSMVDLAYNLLWSAAAVEGRARAGATVRMIPPVDAAQASADEQQQGGPMSAEAFQVIEAAAAEDESALAKDVTQLMGEDIDLEGEDGALVLIASPGEPGGPPIIDQRNIIGAARGRKIEPGAPGAELLLIDSWYVIGPFPNPDRRNINQVFPPESVVDLDAVYTGADGTPLRWRFVQSSGPEMVPPDMRSYAIYYAYTEFELDQPRDLWVAVGSDDYSKLWINGQLVWASGKQHKGWRVNEGWRKVRFSQGTNRILYRVENGWMGMGWSLVVALQPL